MSINQSSAINLIQSTKGVIGAVDMLKIAITEGDASNIDFASKLLSSSADSYSGSVAKYSNFGFDELVASETDMKSHSQIEDDLLASALIDLGVANTLIAAGRAAGECGERPPLEELEQARQNLEAVTNAVALSMGKTAITTAGQMRFGFDEAKKVPVASGSNDPKTKYAQQSEALLGSLLEGTKNIIKEATSIVENLESSKIAAALNLVGTTVEALPEIGKLIAKGLELARQAIEKIMNLIGEKNMKYVKDKAKEMFDNIKGGGNLVDEFLANAYGNTNATEYIEEKLKKTSSNPDKIDEGTKQLVDLQTRFLERSAIAIRIIKLENALYKGIIAVSAALAFTPSLGVAVPGAAIPTATLILMGSCLVVLSYTVLTGMDYADTSKVFVAVPGVIEVTNQALG